MMAFVWLGCVYVSVCVFQISKGGGGPDFQSSSDCQYPVLLLDHVFHDFSKISVKKKVTNGLVKLFW